MASGGPYVQAACLCEMVIEDKFGVLSLIRIIDTLTHTESGPNPPDEMPPVPYSMKLVLMLKSGKARGRHNLRVVPESPTGETKESSSWTVHFEGEEKGANWIVNLAIVFDVEGLYWFNIYLEEEELTAIPLRVKYNRIVIAPMPG